MKAIDSILVVVLVICAAYLIGFGFAMGVSVALKAMPLTVQQNTTVRYAK